MRRLATEAELRALRAQLNPHFLFNALNTLGHLMQAAPDRALATLYQLTALLRAVLRRTNGQFVALREELEIVESYLAIEHERFQERLDRDDRRSARSCCTRVFRHCCSSRSWRTPSSTVSHRFAPAVR